MSPDSRGAAHTAQAIAALREIEERRDLCPPELNADQCSAEMLYELVRIAELLGRVAENVSGERNDAFGRDRRPRQPDQLTASDGQGARPCTQGTSLGRAGLLLGGGREFGGGRDRASPS